MFKLKESYCFNTILKELKKNKTKKKKTKKQTKKNRDLLWQSSSELYMGQRFMTFFGIQINGSHKMVTIQLSSLMTKPTKWHVRPAKTQISLGIHPVWSESLLSA